MGRSIIKKKCSKCLDWLDLSNFSKSSYTKDKLKSRCRACRYAHEYRKTKDKDPVAYKTKQNTATNLYRKNHPERRKDQILRELFGITLVEYETQLAAQGGVCCICKNPETTKTKSGELKRLSVDHNHQTNLVRGLLCQLCNTGLGAFKDSGYLLLEAIQYLKSDGRWTGKL